MLLRKELELTKARVEYDHMIRTAGVLSGHELELHRERMNQLADKIQKLRKEVDGLIKPEPRLRF